MPLKAGCKVRFSEAVCILCLSRETVSVEIGLLVGFTPEMVKQFANGTDVTPF